MANDNHSSNHSGSGLLGAAGAVGAAVLSWIANHSIGWAIVHFCCSWLYVIYWILVKTDFYNWLVSIYKG